MSPLLYCAIGDSEEEFFQSNIARVLLLVEEDLKTLVNNFKRLFLMPMVLLQDKFGILSQVTL